MFVNPYLFSVTICLAPGIYSTGIRCHKSRLRRTGSSEMFLPVFVRLPRLGPSHHIQFSFAHAFPCSLNPSHVYSVGRPKHIRVMAGALEGDVFIGRKAQEFRGLLKIKYPMEHGIVTDWDDMERIWSWVYAEELGTLSEEVSLTSLIPCG